MKKILIGFLALVLLFNFTENAMTQGDPAARMRGLKQTLYSLGASIFAPNKQITKVSGVSSLIETGNTNLLENPSFEHQTYDTGWTCSAAGDGVISEESSNVLDGSTSIQVDTTADNFECYQDSTLYVGQIALGSGIQGIASVWLRGTDTTVQVCARQAGTTSSTDCVTINASVDQWIEYTVPFVFGATSNGISIKGTAGTGTTYIDAAQVSIMPASKMPEISQAQIAVEAYFAGTANCLWSRASATLGAYTADADCPGPTIVREYVGDAQTTDVDLPEVTINNLPAGRYKATFIGEFYSLSAGSSMALAINDGTTTCAAQPGVYGTSGSGISVSCYFDYTEIGNRSFEIYSASAANTASIFNQVTSPSNGTKFMLEYYPPKSKIYSGATQYPQAQVAGEAYFAGTANCIWPRTSATVGAFTADADCPGPTIAFQNMGSWQTTDVDLPIVTVNSLIAGTYKATFLFSNRMTGAGSPAATIYDGSTSCYNMKTFEDTTSSSSIVSCFFTYTSTGNKSFQLYAGSSASTIQVLNDNTAPANGTKFILEYYPPTDNPIIGSFKEVITAPGLSKPKTCYYAFGGASATLASPTECAASPCVEVYDSCNAVTPPTRGGAGLYENVTFAAGTFANSTYMHCDCVSFDSTTNTIKECTLTFNTSDQSWQSSSSGGYVTSMYLFDRLGSITDGYVSLFCTGNAP